MCLILKGMNDKAACSGAAHVHTHVLMYLHSLDFMEIC